MFKILSKRRLNPTMTWLVIDAPLVAKKARPGQFIILRTDEYGERIPLTMAGHDAEKGTIDLIYAAVGRTTMLMDQLEEGDYLLDVVGPLGKPTHMEGLKRVAVVGGGTGNALAYPLATGMHKEGIHVDMIAGFKNKEMVILEDEFKAGTDRLFLTTDDGSYGEKGFTTDKLKELIEAGKKIHEAGIEIVVISLGADGSLLICADGVYQAIVPRIDAVNTVGCGDSMIAGFALGFERGLSVQETLRLASAISASAALREETGFFVKEDMERILPQIEIKRL